MVTAARGRKVRRAPRGNVSPNLANSAKAVAAGTIGVVLAATAACGAEPGQPDDANEGGDMRPQVVQAADVERERPAAGAEVEPTATGISAFGHDLLGVADAPDRNIIVSPASIAYAFGMTRAGARGDTADQMDQVLRFPSRGLHEALNAITYDTVTVDGPPPTSDSGDSREPGDRPKPPVVTVANGLFARAGFEIRQEFLRTLAAQYGAGVRTVDFTSADAVEAINEWAAENTAGRIEKVFDRLDPRTALVLANAVYFKADWQVPFEENATRNESFTTAAGEDATVPMMHQTARLGYAMGDGWQAVELPYAGDELAMRVLVPTGDTAPTALLEPETLAAVGDSLRPGLVDFSMPRFDFATDVPLKKSLQDLGMSVPFDPNAADFSGIGVRQNLYISQAVHKANITVDEWGTEAAAVTAVGMRVTAMPVAEATIRADRAFAFTIVHKPTGTPLFMGQVADPGA